MNKPPVNSKGGGVGHNIRIITWNVRGLGGQIKRSRVFSHLKTLSSDIMFLQETHLRMGDHIRLRKQWIGQVYHSSFNSKSRGTAILIHKRVMFLAKQVISDPEGRFVIVSGVLFHTPVVLVNVYAPNWDNPTFMSMLFSKIPNLDTHHLIFGGDLNCVIDNNLDKSVTKSTSSSTMSRSLISLTNQIGCVDPWRFFHPSDKVFSFFSSVHHVYSRIDYFFLDKALLSSVISSDYSAIVISDHAPHMLDISFLPPFKSRPQWKFDVRLLARTDFCEFLSKNIDFFIETNKTESVSASLLWETFKAFIRGRIISFSAHLAKIRKSRQQELIHSILEVDSQYSRDPKPDLKVKRLKLQTEFDLLSTNKAEYLLKRTKATYYEHGDRAGRLLASQLKHQSASRFITQIYDNHSNKLVTDPQKINSVFSSFYSSLYTSQPPSDVSLMESFLHNLNIPTINTSIQETLDEPLRLDEITTCIGLMQCNKAPGPDGFPLDFYKKFSVQLAPLLFDMYKESFEHGFLPTSLNQASISLLLKKNKDPTLCSSYRPISLLNADVKILAKVLAKRIDVCLPNIISEDQTGFIRGRQMSSNIRRLLNILFSPSLSTKSEMIISLDAEKAFDRVEWNYLFTALKKFGFGNNIISWIRLLYTAPSASVKTNADSSSFFPLFRGTRQGCPLSPLLFALAIEPLSIALKTSPSICGIHRGGTEHRVSLYADDLLLYVQDPVGCVNEIMHLLDTFGSFSGYKLNFTKSECFPINDMAKKISKSALPFHFSPAGFRYLGVNISYPFSSLFKNNFTNLVDQIKLDLKRWDSLPLSLVGRVETIKMNVLPRLLFLFQSLPLFLPKSFFKCLDKILSSFIWAGKIPKVNRSILQRNKCDGGLALPNFIFYYWSANISKIFLWCNAPEVNWCTLEATSCLSSSLPALVFAPLSLRPSSYTKNPIVLSTLKIWKQFRQHFRLESLSVSSPICNNHLFLPPGIDHTFKRWRDKGIVCFSDLFIDNSFATFTNLISKFNLHSTGLFRYFQLRNFAKTNFPSFPLLPEKSLLEKLLSASTGGSRISSIHAMLLSSSTSSLNCLKITWENELQIKLSQELWSEALARVNSTTVCARLSLIQLKVLHRIHLTKARLHKLFPQTEDSCTRCSFSPADHTHTFFSCPKLASFWASFFDFMSRALHVSLSPCPIVAIFGVSLLSSITRQKAEVIAFASLIARRCILLHWKCPTPPPTTSWLKDLMSFLSLEKLKYATRGSTDKFYKTWNPILNLYDSMSSLDSD